MLRALCLLLILALAPLPAAAQIQSDCRGTGTIGMAVMARDGTITLSLHSLDGAMGTFAYHKDDPQYARILSHIGGIRPGEHKSVPPFC
jgi:hypothetical protein